MSEPPKDKPKLIIDEDWKSQVEREREELRRASEQEAASGQSDSAVADSEVEQPSAVKRSQPEHEPGDQQLPPPPPASFPFLVSMLGTQALAAMGQLGSGADAPEIRLDYAKHYIDLLGVLEQKTKGNLGEDEADLLSDWLHQLRLGFVEVAKHAPR
jgi:hypothetical protein